MDLDIFHVHKSVVTICGREPKISSEQDGSLLVEVSFPEESAQLCTLSECVSCGKAHEGQKGPGPVCCFPCSEAHLTSSSECDRFRLEIEIFHIRMRDKVSFAEARSTALKSVSSHGYSYAQ
ncbi:hypothetical protein Hamer_G010767, partial [Homarus americanus]